MTFKVWSLFSLRTGHFTGKSIGGTMGPEDLARNVPDDCGVVEGRHDPATHRVDLSTLEVVGYVPPSPGPDHVWNEAALAWEIRPEVAARLTARAAALREIAELEARQARPLRELTIDPGNARARDLLDTIEKQIAALRATLST